MAARVRPRDLGIAAVLAVVQLVGGHFAARNLGVELSPLGYGLLVVGPALVAVRRPYPVPVLVGAIAAAASFVLLGYGYGPIFLSLVVAFLNAGVNGSRARSYPLVPLGYALTVWPVPTLMHVKSASWWQAVGLASWLAVLVGIAEGVRQRRAVVQARQERAVAARRQEQERRRSQASAERLAIARELHDVLGHSLSLINVQAAVALELLPRKPEQAATALVAIRDASRDALGEVHTLLKSIRAADGAPTGPVPSVTDLDVLVHHARAAGVDVDTAVTGAVRKLPSLVDGAAARIVREALTNVVRHAPGARAAVTVGYSPTGLSIRVDNGPSPG
ncbi:MAG: sensor histidine kinase, partial [Mycobacteriaceae bacterium]|nr:sensor histidine kinase [Mycobacteriaceae bacterium]